MKHENKGKLDFLSDSTNLVWFILQQLKNRLKIKLMKYVLKKYSIRRTKCWLFLYVFSVRYWLKFVSCYIFVGTATVDGDSKDLLHLFMEKLGKRMVRKKLDYQAISFCMSTIIYCCGKGPNSFYNTVQGYN